MLLPAPDGPTSAVTAPGAAANAISFRTGTPFSYSKDTSRNSTAPSMRESGSRLRSPASSASSPRSSRMRSRPAKASVTWLPIETIWITGPTSSPRYSVNDTNEPIVMRPASISCAPTHMMATPTTPSRKVEKAATAEKPVMVLATLRKRACTPREKMSASRRSAR